MHTFELKTWAVVAAAFNIIGAFGMAVCAVPIAAAAGVGFFRWCQHWAEGGTHEEANVLPFCSIHHRLVHQGLLAVYLEKDRVVVERADGGRVVAPSPSEEP